MEVTAGNLLSFILDLLGDSSKADAFAEDPTGALANAGLSDISCADVDALAPLIANAAPGAVAIAAAGGAAASGTPVEMIRYLVNSVSIGSYESSSLAQNIWAGGDVRQAFAGDGGLAVGGEFLPEDPVIVGDRNLVASDDAQAAGRDIIQNNGDGNMALGGDQTVAQDDGVIAGGDNIAAGDKVGGNKNEAENTGNTIGGNQNQAENTGNDNSDRSDNSVTVGGNQHNEDNTGNDN